MTDKEWIRIRRDEFEALIEDRACLLEAAQAVINQWDTPNWKLEEPTATLINNLKTAVERAEDE